MKRILVVCVGNICRSPVAQGLLQARLPHSKVSSAGLAALVGQPADAMAAQVARQHGIDISDHRAQQLAGWMCTQADLVLVMEASHQHQLEQQYPLARGKIRRLGEFGAPGPFDVADPYQQPLQAFERAHAAIAHGVEAWASRIQQLA